MTDQLRDLDEIDVLAARLYEYAAPADAGWEVLAGEDVPALVAEVRRLRAELAREERLHGDTIDDRDRFHDMADKFAYAVAPEEVIGEHSSMNCPWENALDLITPMAEVEKLREELERQTALAEQGARANQELKRLRAELAEYEVMNPQQCPAGKHADWLVDSEHTHACPWCEIEKLRAVAVESHVVADDSDDPEHVDDCPGCASA